MVFNFFPFEMKEKEKSKVKRQMTDCIENENDQKMEREKIEQKNDNFFYRWCLVQTLSSLETRNDEKREKEK